MSWSKSDQLSGFAWDCGGLDILEQEAFRVKTRTVPEKWRKDLCRLYLSDFTCQNGSSGTVLLSSQSAWSSGVVLPVTF